MAKDKPYYPHQPIGSLATLAKTLGLPPKLLSDLSRKADVSYTPFNIITKGGKSRDVFEPKYELKRLQKRINSRLFESVEYPFYLQGGIKDDAKPRDYIENSRIHSGSQFLISLDIRDFYGNIQLESVRSVFKHFFKFPDDVSETLVKLVTREGRVPQGACTSSYVANLIFHNSEYSYVKKLRDKGFSYSRLLDDVTISCNRLIPQEEATEIIKYVSGLFREHGLRLRTNKTKLERSDDLKASYAVTGVWVGHGVPKIRRAERDMIRHSVYICERECVKDRYSDNYHDLWNKVSGQVAKLTRLNHVQAPALRDRMRDILPLYDSKAVASVRREVDKMLKRPVAHHSKVPVIDAYRQLVNKLGILGRTNKTLAKALRRQLKARFAGVPTKAMMWE